MGVDCKRVGRGFEDPPRTKSLAFQEQMALAGRSNAAPAWSILTIYESRTYCECLRSVRRAPTDVFAGSAWHGLYLHVSAWLTDTLSDKVGAIRKHAGYLATFQYESLQRDLVRRTVSTIFVTRPLLRSGGGNAAAGVCDASLEPT
jgi:hypothetical protein